MNQDIVSTQLKDPVLSMSYLIDFSDFLSFQETIKSFCQLIEYLNNLHQDEATEEKIQDIISITDLIDKFSERILSFLHRDEQISNKQSNSLHKALQSLTETSIKTMSKKKNFQHLRFFCIAKTDEAGENNSTFSGKESPTEVFDLILNTTDEVISKQNISFYKTQIIDKSSQDSLKSHYIPSFLQSLQQKHISDLKFEFVVEWMFESYLMNALMNEELISTFITSLKNIMNHFGKNSAVMRGLLRALQKDYITIGKISLKPKLHFQNELLNQSNNIEKDCNNLPENIFEQATSLIEIIFPFLVVLAKKDLSYVFKQIITFAFDLNVPKEEYRLIKWNQWRWIRMLATHTWDTSLRAPSPWVISGGSLYCSVIFDCAPAVWLHDYAYLLLERMYAETLVSEFVPTIQHYDYVEFLVRNLKKKSVYYANHPDSYLCLSVLSRLTPRETNKEKSFKYDVNQYTEPNVISKALGILLHMTRI